MITLKSSHVLVAITIIATLVTTFIVLMPQIDGFKTTDIQTLWCLSLILGAVLTVVWYIVYKLAEESLENL